MKSEKEFIDEFWLKCKDKSKCNDKFFKKNIYRNNDYILTMKSCAMFLFAFVIISSVLGGVYAGIVSYNTGKPIIECLGIVFSNEKYDEYKIKANNQVIKSENSTIELVSGVYDKGFSILEFDVKLSQKDKEYLMLDENLLTEKQIKEAEEVNNIVELACKDLKNTVGIILNAELRTVHNRKGEELQIYEPLYENVIIDGKKCNLSFYQETKKVSDYEYKIYLTYLMTDEILNGKKEFTMNFENVVLRNKPEDKKITTWTVQPVENIRNIPLDGEFSITLSTEKISNDTEIIQLEQAVSKYSNITKKVDELIVTPLQIVAKVTTTMDNISTYSLISLQNEKYVGIQEYKVYDSNGNYINCDTIDIEKVVNFSDGTREKIERQEVEPKRKFTNGTMQIIQYVIIERQDELKYITIVPTLQKYENGEKDIIEKEIEMDEIKIELVEK